MINFTTKLRRCWPVPNKFSVLGLLIVPFFVSGRVSADVSVRMGFYRGVRGEMSQTDLRSSFSLWSQELAVSFKVPVTVTFYEDMTRLRSAFDRGEINCVSADAITLARNFDLAELAEGYSVHSYELAREMNPQMDRTIGRVVDELLLSDMHFAFSSERLTKTFATGCCGWVPALHTCPPGHQRLDVFKMNHLEIAAPQELKPFLQLDQSFPDLKANAERRVKDQ